MQISVLPNGHVDCLFTDAELRDVDRFAHRRNDPKIQHGVRSQRVDESQGDLEVNHVGLQGEFAVSRYLEVPIVEKCGLKGDGGVADHWYKGYSIQDKTHDRLYPQPYLYYFTTDDFAADITVQCAVIGRGHVRMFGWLSRWMFEELRETHNFGYGDNACVPVQLLSRMESLKSLSPKG